MIYLGFYSRQGTPTFTISCKTPKVRRRIRFDDEDAPNILEIEASVHSNKL